MGECLKSMQMSDRRETHIHLDVVGGIAGDMFVACLLDTMPRLRSVLEGQILDSAIGGIVSLTFESGTDKGIHGGRMDVQPISETAQSHRGYREIIEFIQSAGLRESVVRHAKGIFSLLADAEASVHGVSKQSVVFHEVGAWDSIADIVAAAILIDELEASWSCSPLPIGGGIVSAAHGPLPVPAPATTLLLRGFEFRSDGVPGERITPTGAAILKYLRPSAKIPGDLVRLEGGGFGLGSKELPGISNVLRALCFSLVESGFQNEEVVEIRFEVDDQSAEDLGVGIDHIRQSSGVLEVTQCPLLGKKGRFMTQVQILCRPDHTGAVMDACFKETTTLGVRWQPVNRQFVKRESLTCEVDGQRVRVKQAQRPGHIVTTKAEIEDLDKFGSGHNGRQQLRVLAERAYEDVNEL
jgi:hypothetical protein